MRSRHKSKELIPAKITNGWSRYYSENQLKKYLGLSNKTKREVIIYSRVSNRGQIDDLKNQIRFLKQLGSDDNAKSV